MILRNKEVGIRRVVKRVYKRRGIRIGDRRVEER